MIVFRRVARVRHNRRPARSLGDAMSEAEPEAVACSPGGGQRRRTAGESEKHPHVSARVPHAPRVHEGAPKQRSAACLRRVGNRRNCRAGDCPYFLRGTGLRRLTRRVMRHDVCRICRIRNLTRSAKGCCVQHQQKRVLRLEVKTARSVFYL